MTPPQSGSLAQAALQTLSVALARGEHPLQWWEIQISRMLPEIRRIVLHELAVLLANEMRGISQFAKSLTVDKFKHPAEFESILFDFLMPLHHVLVSQQHWDEALCLESIIYIDFIKQDEDHQFYEKSFKRLYFPYQKILSASPIRTISGDSTTRANDLEVMNLKECGSSDESMLFWFQNYSVLAHTQLVLDLFSNLTNKSRVYASALSNTNLDSSRAVFTEAGIKILPVDDQKNLENRCQQLASLCKVNNISTIVFVSLPLQSGYLKKICDGVRFTWWSMKYPLGCMPHFDHLVCNRSLYPTQKKFFGANWHCAPFALKPLAHDPKQRSAASDLTNLKIGVLAREEKFASSQLPEILHQCLISNPALQLFWTGRTKHLALNQRLHGTASDALAQRIHFCGWVDPSGFLSNVDLLVDTPNLGGMVAYWMMSMGKVVISATDSGSVGALGSPQELREHFDLLESIDQVNIYFSSNPQRPYYLSNSNLIPLCIEKYHNQRGLLGEHGQLFLGFFDRILSDMHRWSRITYEMLQSRD